MACVSEYDPAQFSLRRANPQDRDIVIHGPGIFPMSHAPPIYRKAGESLVEGQDRRGEILDGIANGFHHLSEQLGSVSVDHFLLRTIVRVSRSEHVVRDRSTVRVGGVDGQSVPGQLELVLNLSSNE